MSLKSLLRYSFLLHLPLLAESTLSSCDTHFEEQIILGDSNALYTYIKNCHNLPDDNTMQMYQISSYRNLERTSLVCVGDYYAPKIIRLSYIAYSLGAQKESLQAQVSLGLMLDDPAVQDFTLLSKAKEDLYKDQAEHSEVYNRYRAIQTLMKMTDQRTRRKYLSDHKRERKAYANNCTNVLRTDIKIVENQMRQTEKKAHKFKDHDTKLWAQTQLHILQTKAKRLKKTFDEFTHLAQMSK